MVSFSPCPDYEPASCRRALETAADLSWVRPGMRIGIKANLVHAAKPDEAATTHPMLLRCLTDLLKERGATVVIGDSPGGLYNEATLSRVYRVCGLHDTGAELNRDFSIREVEYPEGRVLKHFTATAWQDGCDALINFAKLKAHGMMAMTGAVKNLFGLIPGTIKPEYHYRFPEPLDFAHMLVDIQEYQKPQLHLVDAVVCMEGNGPTAGTPRHMGLLLASDNAYDLDQVCVRLLGLEPEAVLTQRAALSRSLVKDLDFPEALLPYCQADFKIPPTKSNIFKSLLPGKAGDLLGETIGRLIAPRPTLSPTACIACGKCAQLCPARAITMKHKKPHINRHKCIGCFCCQEFCPKGALEAKRPPIARLLSK
ncbi:MAG: DUF362 domain-containing protein [Oscillospiraceae bacterium]|nr:DUF362 domain-containing protein [Oscillospiraceae bacterium]